MANLPTMYTTAYNDAKIHNFTDSEGGHVGWFKETQDHKGRVSFVSFHNAGHMVSFLHLSGLESDKLTSRSPMMTLLEH
jgi:carboxypeptidase C (cathepsin A)